MNRELIRLLDLQLDQLKKEKRWLDKPFWSGRMASIRKARKACIDELISHIDAILNSETVKGLFEDVGLLQETRDES
tara:strand:+ start:266 stop:496 length:231 start_codon:yes stop_codon:yes gene_type:complete